MSGREVLARRLEDDDPNLRVGVRAPPGLVEVGEDARRLGVGGLRPVQGDDSHPAIDFAPDEVFRGHWFLPVTVSGSWWATSSNFLTLPAGVIGSASMKCQATGVFCRASPTACRCRARSASDAREPGARTTKEPGTSPNRASGPGTT